jgi:hypothetical protein
VRIEHLLKPGPLVEDSRHFLIVRVDGDRLSLGSSAFGGGASIPLAASRWTQLKQGRISRRVSTVRRIPAGPQPRAETSPRWRARRAPDDGRKHRELQPPGHSLPPSLSRPAGVSGRPATRGAQACAARPGAFP